VSPARLILPLVFGMALMVGCGLPAQSSSVAPEPESGCSFRSPTTCWTMAARFPAARSAAQDSVPGKLLQQPPTTVVRALGIRGPMCGPSGRTQRIEG
jgi:hypothetical protein